MPPTFHDDSTAVNSGGDNLAIDLVWGATSIGKVIGRSRRQAYNLLTKGHIKSAKRVGKMWAASLHALRAEFGAQ